MIICSTGHRSSMGCSILKQHGLSRVRNAAGGMTEYNATGFGPERLLSVLFPGLEKPVRKENRVLRKSKSRKVMAPKVTIEGWIQSLSIIPSFFFKNINL